MTRISDDDISAGFDEGEFTWWTVSIFGRGIGIEIARHHAAQIDGELWQYTQEKAHRFFADRVMVQERDAESHGPQAMTIDTADTLAMLVSHGHATEAEAREEAVRYLTANSIALIENMREHVKENMNIIGRLSFSTTPALGDKEHNVQK